MSKKQASDTRKDAGQGHGGKVENDSNQAGAQDATQKNEARRTPQSRHDRDSQLGSGNQSQSRQGSGAKSGH